MPCTVLYIVAASILTILSIVAVDEYNQILGLFCTVLCLQVQGNQHSTVPVLVVLADNNDGDDVIMIAVYGLGR